MAKKKVPGDERASAVPATQAITASGAASAAKVSTPYVVLARKYRPETFEDLIGQDAMVRTLKNAFAADRIAQGYMLTGVRGVGKTTTARILARALNYKKAGMADRPTVDMAGYGDHCIEIIQSRHPDVLEIDAASNTGVDNIRELIESARYRPLSARTKVYIIDEVHMLSKGAFNALLKTLEEPPAHVKFIFATTEVRKVPITVLSRCQRFDLRRVDVPLLVAHLRMIVAKEAATAEDEALALIGRAAEGSVRDGLSLLDQAIAFGAGKVTATATRAMLGLADRGRIFDLLEHLAGGAAGEALGALAELNRDGAEPGQVVADLAEAVHAASRVKVAGEAAAGEGLSAEEKRRVSALAARLSLSLLSRAWQMLLKGLEEVARAPDPLAAAEMVLIRIAYTADLPSPDEIIRALGPGRAAGADGATARPAAAVPKPPAPRASSSGPAAVAPASLADVAELAGEQRDAKLKVHLEEHVSLVRFEPGRIELGMLDGAPPGLAGELSEKLSRWTGRRWIIAVSRAPGEVPLGAARRAREAAQIAEIKNHPAVAALLETFPEAQITQVRPLPRHGRQAPEDDSAAG